MEQAPRRQGAPGFGNGQKMTQIVPVHRIAVIRFRITCRQSRCSEAWPQSGNGHSGRRPFASCSEIIMRTTFPVAVAYAAALLHAAPVSAQSSAEKTRTTVVSHH